MTSINLSFEEIARMSTRGTLEQYILSNGYRYQDFLLYSLEKASEKVEDLEQECLSLEEKLEDLDEDYECLLE